VEDCPVGGRMRFGAGGRESLSRGYAPKQVKAPSSETMHVCTVCRHLETGGGGGESPVVLVVSGARDMIRRRGARQDTVWGETGRRCRWRLSREH